MIMGGIGLFLYGMATMSSGLRKLAGDRLRNWLGRTTRTPLSGAATGAAVTALIQSSSATTLAAIGFVTAGLLSFNQALGIIFGANIGTTLTGWMVALIGFKLKLTSAALPLLFVAAILYLIKDRRVLRGSGKALAGFCLIFVGIGYMQEGMAGYSDSVSLSRWPALGIGGRLLLLGIGVVLTMITQSSSATVATAITALSAGMLTLPQTAAVIIGADIGTTFTAALATIGAPTAARRTGFAHVVYNLLTGAMAFLLLPGYLWLLGKLAPESLTNSAELVAVGFHSTFNILGVLLVLPFTGQFAKLIEHLFPESPTTLTAPFNKLVLEDVSAANEALEQGVRGIAAATLKLTAHALHPESTPNTDHPVAEIQEALSRAREFTVQVGARAEEEELGSDQRFHCLHLIDQTDRLLERTHNAQLATELEQTDGELTAVAQRLAKLLLSLRAHLESPDPGCVEELGEMVETLEGDKPNHRKTMIERASRGELSAEKLDLILDMHRSLRRVAYHSWRLGVYALAIADEPKPSAASTEK